jgi:RAM signalling pathway protein
MLSITESSLKTDVNGNTSDRPSWVPHLSDTHTASIGALQGNRRDAGVEMPSPTSLSANSSFEVLPDTEQMHLRAASYASTLHKPLPKVKKSLPNLRIDKVPPKTIPNALETPHDEGRTIEESFNLSSLRKDSDVLHPEYIQASNALPSLTMDCASYFRRSATLTVNNSLPNSLLCLLESARSILFAMNKLYQTLEQYMHHGFDEQPPSIFKKLLDPANMNITFLIRSLDRFDDFSQKARPPSAVCRALAESCRDVVITMKKAVGLLTLQIDLEPFNRRYSRWLILELYAITAEIALAWQAIVPYIDSLGPFLYGSVFSHAYHVGNMENLAGPTSLINADQRFVRLRSAETLHGGSGPSGIGRVRMTRRHAGSFSSKDVEIGKELPSYDILPTTTGRLATHTPRLRIPKRQATIPVFPASLPTLPSYTSNQVYASHPQHSSRSSLEVSSLMSSASESSNIAGVDKEAFQAVREALEVAPVVWDQIEEALGDISTNKDTQQVLENARLVTRRLSDDIHAISEDNPESDKKAVGDSAHLFLKVRAVLSFAPPRGQ